MRDSKSESCLLAFHDTSLKRCSKSEYAFIVTTQQQLISMYIEELKRVQTKLDECNGKICRMKHFSEFDTDSLVDSILHNVDDKTEYKNAVSFMKNSIHFFIK